MEITLNRHLSVGYIRFNDLKITKQEWTEDDIFVVDYDRFGSVVGVEILSIKRLIKLLEKEDEPTS